MSTVPAARSTAPSHAAILTAAAAEFAAHGFDGTRMEHVARRADCNKALVYRHFGDKEGLFRAVLEQMFARREEILEDVPHDLGYAIVYWHRRTVDSPEFLRLLQREALNDDGIESVREEARRAYYRRQVDAVRERQRAGEVAPELDAKYLFLALLALIAHPGAFPQITRLVTGHSPGSRSFDRHWSRLLRGLARRLGSSLPVDTDP